ncbi:MAG: PKD domain-containing protein [Methanoregula sp.]|nr:PKD domain-containing protein [Methanoregula sp.]
MGRDQSVHRKDRAVSEVIGSILLISVVVIGIAVIGVLLMSQPTPRNLPALSAVISEDTAQNTISIYHDGGDQVSHDEIQILVDGVPRDFDIGGSTGWSTWSMGQSLTYQYSGSAPGLVQIVYNGGSGATVLASSDFGFNPSGTLTTGPTGTATTIPTSTTPTPVPAPVANFTASPLTGTAPLTVQFTDHSTNSPTSWSWNFGDGNTANSTVQNPLHTYANPGNYTVSLTVANGFGSNTSTRTNYITVTTPAPLAAFTGTPLSGTTPLAVRFTDLSTNSPTSWSWNFGDGNTTNATVQNPVHVYNSVGLYTVSLTAANAIGSNTSTRINYVNVTISNFTSYIIQNNVFVYGTQLNFQGNNVYGDGATIIITSPLYGSTLNGGAQIAVSNIFIDGDVTLNTGSTGMGSPSSPRNISINGNLNLNGGNRDIYGDVYVADNLALENCRIHGNMYVNGNVALDWGVPSIDTGKNIYYTGTLTHPNNYDQAFLDRCIHQTSVPSLSMPSQTLPSLKPDQWYLDKGYSTSTSSKLTNNLKIIANSFTSSDSSDTGGVSNIVIIAKTGDITLDSYWQHYPVTGVLYAPNGKVTFSGNSFTGVVIARDGFYVTSGSTTVTFTNLANYFSSPNDYPF